MNPEDKRKRLASEGQTIQAHLDKIRELRMDISLKNREALQEYRMKLGELSFTVGAAIVPVIIVSDNKIQHIKYAFVGVMLYLLSGLLLYLRGRKILYQDAEDAPQVGLDEEILLIPVMHAIGKLTFSPTDATYRNEYTEASKHLLESVHESQEQPRKPHVDFAIELWLCVFILATLFMARTVWPFEAYLFWVVFWVIIILAVATLTVLYIQIRKSRSSLQRKRDQVAAIQKKHQKWLNSNVLR